MRSKSSLYLFALILEFFCGLIRTAFIVAFVVFTMYFLFIIAIYPANLLLIDWTPNGFTKTMIVVAILFSYSNIIASWVAYIGFGGGSVFTRFVLGARELSSREHEILTNLFEQMISQVDFDIGGFSKLYIYDSPMEFVNLIGTTLYVSSGAIDSEYLPPLIAHEFGHLNNKDGNTILALRRLVFPLFYMFIGGVRDFSSGRPAYRPDVKEFEATEIFYSMINKVVFFLFAFFGGGIGVWGLSWWWAAYFRQQDFFADAYAAKLGYKDELLKYLEEHKFFDSAVPYMLGWRPAHELRIDALNNPDLYGLEEVKKAPTPSR